MKLPSTSLFLTCVSYLSLILAVCWGGCDSSGLVLVSISQWPPGVQTLDVTTSLGGKAGQDINLTPPTQGFAVSIPGGAEGPLVLDAQGKNQCASEIAAGHLEVPLDAQTTFPVREGLELVLSAQPPLLREYPRVCLQTTIAPFGTSTRWGTIWGSSPNDVWIGGDGQLLHWDGSSLSLITLPILPRKLLAINGIWGSSTDDLWIVGDHGNILHWDGNTWAIISSGTNNDFYGVWGSGPNDVWAVGSMGTILHWNGSNSTVVQSASESNLRSIWGSGPSDIWAVGFMRIIDSYFSTIMHWNGNTWAEVPSPPAASLNSIWGSGPDDIWAVGDFRGTILHWNGSAWSFGWFAPGEEFTGLTSVWGSDPNNVWVTGSSGSILRWNGVGWSKIFGITPNDLVGVWGTRMDDVWSVGSQGTILHFQRCPSPAQDDEPPMFGGLEFINSYGINITLDWHPANDNMTPPEQMVYQIYQANCSGKENYVNPSFTTAPGSLTYTVTNVKPNNTYYFVVRAQNQSGKLDSNTREQKIVVGSSTSFTKKINNMFSSECTGSVCHSGVSTSPPLGLDLSTDSVTYHDLVNIKSSECPSTMRILPMEPSMSYLISKLQGGGPCFSGARMPLGGQLSADNIALIWNWIQSGAPNN